MNEQNYFLNESEVSALRAFNANPTMKDAVKKVLLDNIYGQDVMKAGIAADPLHSRALVIVQESFKEDNQVIGQRLRAFAEAVSLLEHGFNNLDKFTKVEKPEKKQNNAR
jgi:hypothetical protein